MDTILALINAASSGLIALALFAAVVSTRVHDGIVIKVGLISMALGFGSVAVRLLDGFTDGDAVGLAKSLVLINSGIAVAIVGYLLRRVRAGHPVRRVTDLFHDPKGNQ